LKGEVGDARDGVKAAKARDVEEAAAAYARGEEPADLGKNQREAEALIAELEAKLKALDIAVDRAGTALAEAIVKHRREWREVLNEPVEDTARRWDKALAEMQAALRDLQLARGGAAWLDAFDLSAATIGRQVQFTGGRVRIVDYDIQFGTLRGEQDPAELLKLLRLVTHPQPDPREARRQAQAKREEESRKRPDGEFRTVGVV
jgi:hypothetical protein